MTRADCFVQHFASVFYVQALFQTEPYPSILIHKFDQYIRQGQPTISVEPALGSPTYHRNTAVSLRWKRLPIHWGLHG